MPGKRFQFVVSCHDDDAIARNFGFTNAAARQFVQRLAGDVPDNVGAVRTNS